MNKKPIKYRWKCTYSKGHGVDREDCNEQGGWCKTVINAAKGGRDHCHYAHTIVKDQKGKFHGRCLDIYQEYNRIFQPGDEVLVVSLPQNPYKISGFIYSDSVVCKGTVLPPAFPGYEDCIYEVFYTVKVNDGIIQVVHPDMIAPNTTNGSRLLQNRINKKIEEEIRQTKERCDYLETLIK